MPTRPHVRVTHTVAEMELSATAYNEIAEKLREAGYDHVFDENGMIDMHGIGLIRSPGPPQGEELFERVSYVMNEKKARGNYAVTIGFLDLETAQQFHQWVAERSSKATKQEIT